MLSLKYISHANKGVTLIELMLALVISMTLLLGVGTIYYNSKRSYLIQDEFAHMQESARIAMKFISEDIRMAGHVGCVWNNDLDHTSFLTTLANAADNDAMINYAIGMEGFEANGTAPGSNVTTDLSSSTTTWHATLPSFISGSTRTPIRDSDILVVRYAQGNGFRLTQNKAATHLWIDPMGDNSIDGSSGTNCHIPSDICVGDLLIASDCQKSRLFQATALSAPAEGIQITHNNTGTPGNAATHISWGTATDHPNDFDFQDSYVYKATAYAYYVANAANGQPSLYRIELRPGATPEELVQGVENMQILYGIDTDKTAATEKGDGVANRYRPANAVATATDHVISARISLLLRTADEINKATTVAATSSAYRLTGMTNATSTRITPEPGGNADRRLRRVFTTTIKIRNKGLQ